MPSTFQSETGQIGSMLLKHARDAFIDQATIDEHWRRLNFLAPPDSDEALREYDAFAELLATFDIEMHFLPKNATCSLDSIYVRDASIVCDRGAILCNMGKPARRSEPAACRSGYERLDLPILGTLEDDARIEGGDLTWLDSRTLVIGEGYRSNAAGIAAVRELMADCVEELLTPPLPHWHGEEDVFHLMSVLSPIDEDLLLVFSPLLSVPFRQRLLALGKTLVEVPEEEFDSMGCNVLAVAPRTCVMLDNNPITRKRLEQAGAEVHVYKGDEISRKGCGGPTCLTRPLARSL